MQNHYRNYHIGLEPEYLRHRAQPNDSCYTNLPEFLADPSIELEKKPDRDEGREGRRVGWKKQKVDAGKSEADAA